MATKSELERGSDGRFHHGCGESFQYASWYTNHALRCSGKPVQTRGRIDRLAARASRHANGAVRRTHPTPSGRALVPVDRTPPTAQGVGAIQTAATDKAIEIVIAGLIAKRAQIDAAIAALQAVSA